MKNIVKTIANAICLVIAFPLFVVYSMLGALGNKDSSLWGFSQFLSLLPGALGNYLRKNFYRLSMTRCNKDCAILFGTIFSQVDTEIGKGVYIGPHCNIGKCRIEDYCTIGSNVHIMSGKRQHNFEDLETPIQEQGGVFEKIVIGENTWIGNCALVMANVGKKCIVGAGSVVTKNVNDYSIVAGNPAKVI
ncbi:MAG: acyltransferase, partial [Proteobacteria bacterium]|nr:acyltransferase [Pseudomonadota bacterium]